MPSLLTLRPTPGGPSWSHDAIPHAYDEAGRVQFNAMPGVGWVRSKDSPNGRGFYRGPAEAIGIVVATLEAAKVIKVIREAPGDLDLADIFGHVGPAALFLYQRDGAGWVANMLQESGGALLADEMGLGKSAQACAAATAIGAQSILIVCPAIVVPHWKAQWAKWGDTDADLRITSYEGFVSAHKGGTKKIPPLGAYTDVIIDEIHYCANPKAQRSKAMAEFLAAAPVRPRVQGLTGTPMTARPKDLHNVLDIIWPGRFGRSWNFQKRYCNGRYVEIPNTEKVVWDATGISHPEELGERLRAVMLRRTKAEVGTQLPPRTRTVVEVSLPPRAMKDLGRAASAIDWTGKGTGVSALLSNIEEYKVDAAVALAKEALANGSRCLLLTTRKATAAALGEALQAPVVDGDTPAADRRAVIADAPIGVATMYSVTTGIDLVGFDVVIFTGLDWIPSTLLQAEARVHRIGQTRNVTIFYLVGLGTLDEVVRGRVIERLDTFDTIVGNDTTGMGDDFRGGDTESLLASIVANITEANAA